MNTKDKMILQNSQELISRIMKERNADTDDCVTTTNLARDIGIPRADFAEFLKPEQEYKTRRVNPFFIFSRWLSKRGMPRFAIVLMAN